MQQDRSLRRGAYIHAVVIALLVAALWMAAAAAQIIILPPYPPRPPWPEPPAPPIMPRPTPAPVQVQWRELNVEARIREQTAEVSLEHVLFNAGTTVAETEYIFPLPDGAAVDSLVLLADGQELTGQLLDADAAKRRYEEIVRSMRDPALLQYSGRGALRVAVFPLPPGAERRLLLRYTLLLKREGDRLRWETPLMIGNTTAPPERVQVHASLEHPAGIGTIYSPQAELTPTRDGAQRAQVKWQTTGSAAPRAFRLDWTITEPDGRKTDQPLGTFYSYRPDAKDDGYFLLLLSPPAASMAHDSAATTQPKTLIAVLDRSGSMLGGKIEQARAALDFIVDQLRPGDTFNLIAFDDRVETYKPELQRVDEASRRSAHEFVAGIRAGGSTNIGEALRASLEQVKTGGGDKGQPAYILFLTDGQPTAGEQRELVLAQQVREQNRAAKDARARVFVFGVGDDVNARLLERLCTENGGASSYIGKDENIEAPVARLATRLTAPLLTRLELAPSDGKLTRVYPDPLPDLFAGDQLALLGRYTGGGEATLNVKGQVQGHERTFKLPVTFAKAGERADNAFVPRLWATRRIGELLDQIDLNGRNQELVDELVALSKQHGILTPYTAFLAEEETQIHNPQQMRVQAGERLNMLDSVSGAGAVQQRAWRGELKTRSSSAPEVIGNIPDAIIGDSEPPVALGMPRSVVPLGQSVQGTLAAPEEKRPAPMATLRTVGDRTFFLREGVWQDAALTPEEIGKATRMPLLGEDYMKLLEDLDDVERTLLTSFAEPVVLRLGTRVVWIEQAIP